MNTNPKITSRLCQPSSNQNQISKYFHSFTYLPSTSQIISQFTDLPFYSSCLEPLPSLLSQPFYSDQTIQTIYNSTQSHSSLPSFYFNSTLFSALTPLNSSSRLNPASHYSACLLATNMQHPSYATKINQYPDTSTHKTHSDNAQTTTNTLAPPKRKKKMYIQKGIIRQLIRQQMYSIIKEQKEQSQSSKQLQNHGPHLPNTTSKQTDRPTDSENPLKIPPQGNNQQRQNEKPNQKTQNHPNNINISIRKIIEEVQESRKIQLLNFNLSKIPQLPKEWYTTAQKDCDAQGQSFFQSIRPDVRRYMDAQNVNTLSRAQFSAIVSRIVWEADLFNPQQKIIPNQFYKKKYGTESQNLDEIQELTSKKSKRKKKRTPKVELEENQI